MAKLSTATTPADPKDVIKILPPLDCMVFSTLEKKCFDGIVFGVLTDSSMLSAQFPQKKNGKRLVRANLREIHLFVFHQL